MRRSVAAVGSAAFFVVAPGTMAGVLPWLISRWRIDGPGAAWAAVPVRVLAAVLIAGGAVFVIQAFVRFVVEGLGTPLPAAPPDRLVVGGVFRYVRNPMYVALTAVNLGQALLFWQPALVAYAIAALLAAMAFVHWYEEPKLRRTFGAGFEEYIAHVPGWWPRLSPWRPGHR